MASFYLLDTNILVHLVRRDAVGRRIQSLYSPLMAEPRPIISIVSAGELRSLGYQLKWGLDKTQQAHFLLNYFKNISIDDGDIIDAYAVLDAYSVSVGHSMGKNDLWIAATAKVTGGNAAYYRQGLRSSRPTIFESVVTRSRLRTGTAGEVIYKYC